jgi:hypothetical protein
MDASHGDIHTRVRRFATQRRVAPPCLAGLGHPDGPLDACEPHPSCSLLALCRCNGKNACGTDGLFSNIAFCYLISLYHLHRRTGSPKGHWPEEVSRSTGSIRSHLSRIVSLRPSPLVLHSLRALQSSNQTPRRAPTLLSTRTVISSIQSVAVHVVNSVGRYMRVALVATINAKWCDSLK